eukprot:g3617.t1
MATKDQGEGGKERLQTSVVECVRKMLKSDDSPYKDFDIQGFESHCKVRLSTNLQDDVLKEGKYTHDVHFEFDYFQRAMTLDKFAGDPASLKRKKVRVLSFQYGGCKKDYDGVIVEIRREGDGTYSFRIQYEDDEGFSWMSAERLVLRTAPSLDQKTFSAMFRGELASTEDIRFESLENVTGHPTKTTSPPPVLLHTDGLIYMRLVKNPKWNAIAY